MKKSLIGNFEDYRIVEDEVVFISSERLHTRARSDSWAQRCV